MIVVDSKVKFRPWVRHDDKVCSDRMTSLIFESDSSHLDLEDDESELIQLMMMEDELMNVVWMVCIRNRENFVTAEAVLMMGAWVVEVEN